MNEENVRLVSGAVVSGPNQPLRAGLRQLFPQWIGEVARECRRDYRIPVDGVDPTFAGNDLQGSHLCRFVLIPHGSFCYSYCISKRRPDDMKRYGNVCEAYFL